MAPEIDETLIAALLEEYKKTRKELEEVKKIATQGRDAAVSVLRKLMAETAKTTTSSPRR